MLTVGGIREERYSEERLINILYRSKSLCFLCLVYNESQFTSSLSACNETSLIAPVTILASSVCIVSSSCFS